MLLFNANNAIEAGGRPGGPHERELPPQTVRAQRHAQPDCRFQRIIRHLNIWQQRARGDDAAPQRPPSFAIALAGVTDNTTCTNAFAANDDYFTVVVGKSPVLSIA